MPQRKVRKFDVVISKKKCFGGIMIQLDVGNGNKFFFHFFSSFFGQSVHTDRPCVYLSKHTHVWLIDVKHVKFSCAVSENQFLDLLIIFFFSLFPRFSLLAL